MVLAWWGQKSLPNKKTIVLRPSLVRGVEALSLRLQQCILIALSLFSSRKACPRFITIRARQEIQSPCGIGQIIMRCWKGKVPLLQAAPRPMQGGRGGSESGYFSCGATRISALPPPPVGNSKGQKRARSVTPFPLPSSSCTKRRSKAHSATASLGRGDSTVDGQDDSELDGASHSNKKATRKE